MDRLIRFILPWLEDRRRWRTLMAATVVMGSVWIWLARAPASATTAGRVPSPREGFAAPDFTLPTVTGEALTLSDFHGRVVIVNLWAAWCPPCREEMPALERAYQGLPAGEVEILAVNTTYQDSLPDAASFVDRFGLSFPILIDEHGEVARLYQLRALPSTFFIDTAGVIRKVVIGGPMSESTIRTTATQLLNEGR
jgi:cytochrome c biogenesis protein CcmG/thiol:disulfide interchange protein DsbE